METDGANFISVLYPNETVCKQSDVTQKCVGKLRYRNARIYDIKVLSKERKKLFKKLIERSRQIGDRGQGEYLRQLVLQYVARLRDPQEEVRLPANNPNPLQEFQKMAEDMLQTYPAKFSFMTTKTDGCFIGLVKKQLGENGEMFYFLQDGVKVSNTGVAEKEWEEGGAAGGTAEQDQRHIATVALPHDWKNSFANSLEKNIDRCHGHIGPALEALRMGRNYYDLNEKTCNFNSSGGDRELVQGFARKKFQPNLTYRLHGMNVHGSSKLCKVHLNGDGSDCYLVYVVQNYKKMGRVFLLVGVFTHREVGIKKKAKTKEHATPKASERSSLDITEDMKAAEEYLK